MSSTTPATSSGSHPPQQQQHQHDHSAVSTSNTPSSLAVLTITTESGSSAVAGVANNGNASANAIMTASSTSHHRYQYQPQQAGTSTLPPHQVPPSSPITRSNNNNNNNHYFDDASGALSESAGLRSPTTNRSNLEKRAARFGMKFISDSNNDLQRSGAVSPPVSPGLRAQNKIPSFTNQSSYSHSSTNKSNNTNTNNRAALDCSTGSLGQSEIIPPFALRAGNNNNNNNPHQHQTTTRPPSQASEGSVSPSSERLGLESNSGSQQQQQGGSGAHGGPLTRRLSNVSNSSQHSYQSPLSDSKLDMHNNHHNNHLSLPPQLYLDAGASFGQSPTLGHINGLHGFGVNNSLSAGQSQQILTLSEGMQSAGGREQLEEDLGIQKPTQDRDKCRVSLRSVMAIVTGCIIVVIAVISVVLTNTISNNVVRDLGLSLSRSYISSAASKAEDYFATPVKHMKTMQRLFRKENVTLFSDNPDLTASFYCDGLRALVEAADFSYPTFGMWTDDTGSTAAVVTYGQYGIYGCGLRNTLPGNVLFNDVNYYYMENGTSVPSNLVPSGLSLDIPRADGRSSTYFAIRPTAFNSNNVSALSTVAYTSLSGNDVSLNTPFFVGLRNASNYFIGVGATSIPTSQLQVFFDSIDKTANSHLISIDGSLNILSSTYPVEFQRRFFQPATTPVPSGCLSTNQVLPCGSSLCGIACPETIGNYAYPPMKYLADQNDLTFLNPTGLKVQEVDIDGEEYFILASPVQNEAQLFAIFIFLFLPTNDILGEIVASRNLVIIITCCIFLLAIGVAILAVFILLKPLDHILYLMDRATQLEIDADVVSDNGTTTSSGHSAKQRENLSSISEIYELQLAYRNMALSLSAFIKFLPKEIVKDITEDGSLGRIGMRGGEATISFCDIAGFTSIAERVPNHELAIALAIFFEQMTNCLAATSGNLVTILGDGAMNVWNVPGATSDHELKGALCALMLSRETVIEPLAGAFDDIGERLYLRIGVNSGQISHGNMGCSNRLQWSIYGNEVNLASRLEGQGKVFATRIIMSAATAAKCQNIILSRYLCPTVVVGKEEPVKIFEPVGIYPNIDLDAVLPPEAGDARSVHSMMSVRRRSSIASSQADPGLLSGTINSSSKNRQNQFVSSRKDANISARKIVKDLLKCEEDTLKVSQYEMDFVTDFNQAAELFSEGNPSGCLQVLQDIRAKYPLFYQGDDISYLKEFIESNNKNMNTTFNNNNNLSAGGNVVRKDSVIFKSDTSVSMTAGDDDVDSRSQSRNSANEHQLPPPLERRGTQAFAPAAAKDSIGSGSEDCSDEIMPRRSVDYSGTSLSPNNKGTTNNNNNLLSPTNNSNTGKSSVVKIYQPKSRCEAGLIRAEGSTCVLEILCKNIIDRIKERQAAGGDHAELINLQNEFVYKADAK